jgi:hypothetical protein
MLTIENINILNSKFAGTPEWQVGEMFIGEQNYIFQIHKRVGEWKIQGVKHKEFTIQLVRERLVMGGYVMDTGIVKQNFRWRSIHNIEDFRTINGFTMCLDGHIKNVIR